MKELGENIILKWREEKKKQMGKEAIYIKNETKN